VAASVLLGWSGAAMAGAQSACADLGGTVGPDQICQFHTATPSYKIDFSFPVDYPDQQPVTDYLTQQRNGFIEFAGLPAARSYPAPYQLLARGQTYRSGTPTTGTQTLLLRMGQDAQPHPRGWFKAFNYDLGKQSPITFDTLFKPDSSPLDVIYPYVQQTVQKRSRSTTLPTLNGGLDVESYRNFAITDDAVIFFFDQGQMTSHAEGELEVPIPRTELASILA
jgi:hypothetical protein